MPLAIVIYPRRTQKDVIEAKQQVLAGPVCLTGYLVAVARIAASAGHIARNVKQSLTWLWFLSYYLYRLPHSELFALSNQEK
ncbi:hypothetical protein GCM10028786_34110 [Flaviaesturariibacter terrae]